MLWGEGGSNRCCPLQESADPLAQHDLVARAASVGKCWPELPGTRQRTLLTALIERIDVEADQIDIHLRATRLAALFDVAAAALPSRTHDKTQILSVPVWLRRAGREITMRIDGTDTFATAKPDARLIKLLIRARRFNTALVGSNSLPVCRTGQAGGCEPVLLHAARPPQLSRPGHRPGDPRRASAA